MKNVRSSLVALLLLAFVSQSFAVAASNCVMSDMSSDTPVSDMQMSSQSDTSHHQHMLEQDSVDEAEDCCFVECECSQFGCSALFLGVSRVGEVAFEVHSVRFDLPNSALEQLALIVPYRPPIIS